MLLHDVLRVVAWWPVGRTHVVGYRTRVRATGHAGRELKGLRLARALLSMATSMRPLRYIPPGSVVEVTSRTIQGRLLLRPSPEVNDIILGVIGRGQVTIECRESVDEVLSQHVRGLASISRGLAAVSPTRIGIEAHGQGAVR